MVKKKICILMTLLLISGGVVFGVNAVKHRAASVDKDKREGSITKIEGVNQLKSGSDIIVEVIGTGEHKTRDYKGVPAIITKVQVVDTIKGDKELKELNILQVDGIDVPPSDGERLLMFLRKGVDNEDCYIPVGAGQGIYKISTETSDKKSLNKSDNSEKIEPQSMVNDTILNDLKGNYKDVKEKLKNEK